MKLAIDIKKSTKSNKALVDIEFGTVFSGEINGRKSTFLMTDHGIYDLENQDDLQSAFDFCFVEFSQKPPKYNQYIVYGYKELQATLTIKEA